MRAAQRREKHEQGMADDYEVNTIEAHVASNISTSSIDQGDDVERRATRSKFERWADKYSDEERPKTIQFGTLPPVTINNYLLPGEYKSLDETGTSSPEQEQGDENEEQEFEGEDESSSLFCDVEEELQLVCGQMPLAEDAIDKRVPEMGTHTIEQGGQDDDLTDVEEEIDCTA
ncbi:hypothetical protein Dimus_038998 [Dionaea muscipula]